ncbi:hypothetical protein C8A01DRAFT_40622 [Parachaetomium inaequale]|uniref:2EXR domain-containing protein n=1 Tax=Parachaetomium inaequale TaxID=2588326 RepID=A0AAN6P708_9PEZI|nr:hypothetical protein C8A01DRAFT_40622 [Parachaetomium inaequale]
MAPNPPSPPPPSMSFPLFPLLPTELQDLIWSHAASPTPAQIHFFLNPHHHPPPPLKQSPSPGPLNILPHPESGARTPISLSRTSRAARAAVARHTHHMTHNNIAHLRTTTTFPPPPQPESQSHPSMNLALDLTTDLVCFGAPDADCAGVWDVLDWGAGNRLLFGAVRRFAVRYKSGWEWPGPGSMAHDLRCPGGWAGSMSVPGAAARFCSRCVARLVERFVWLEGFWLIVDDEGGFGEGVEKGEGGEVFSSYRRTYFTPVGSEESAGVEEAGGVLERIRLNLFDPERYQRRWAASIKLGLLAWREDAPA